jgi:SAM-dependent methyltransferase
MRSGASVDLVVKSFDDEWRHYASAGGEEENRIFQLYFDIVEPQWLSPTVVALDAGSGAGRWSVEVARRGPRVIAVDLGESIEVTRSNTPQDRVGCVQADVRNLPVRNGSVDFAYSLGVMHHLESPDTALRKLVEVLRPGGLCLVYLYYALDQRGRGYRAVFLAADAVRRATSRLPRPFARAISSVIALAVYWPLARFSWMLRYLGFRAVADAIPLSFYSDRSLRTMLNDSLDRFGTRLEIRYSRAQVLELLRAAGLRDVLVSDRPPYWHGLGVRNGVSPAA